MRLINGDITKEIDKLINENIKVDLILTDPPYGITESYWDKIIDFKELIPKLYKILKYDRSLILFQSNKFTFHVVANDLENFKYKYVWVKNIKANFLHAKNMPMSQHEDILVFSRASIGHKSLLKDKRMFYEPRNLTEVNQMVKSYGHKYGRVYMPRPSHKEIYKKNTYWVSF